MPDAGLHNTSFPESKTLIVKSEEIALPPLVLSTSLITCSVPGVAPHILLMTVISVVMVSPKDSALPSQEVLAPTVIPASSMTVPLKTVFAPSVVAQFGVQNTSHADEPLVKSTSAFASLFNVPSILKIYVPAPLSVIHAVPTEAAALIQYTPGINGCGNKLRSVATPKIKSHHCAFNALNAMP